MDDQYGPNIVVPAYAGVIPLYKAIMEMPESSPRVCGGDPTYEFNPKATAQ